MNRRRAIQAISALLGGSLVGSASWLRGAVNADASSFANGFTSEALSLLNEVGETILPATAESLGAKAADIGAFMQEIVSSHYSEADRETFLAGIATVDSLSLERFGARFVAIEPAQRHELLLSLEQDASARYYRMMKELTLWGYFTSEIGATQALSHSPIPGRWDPCIEVGPDARAWS